MINREKKKNTKNLIFLEQEKNETALMLAFRVISMHKEDFNLSITDIAKILLCDRQWVVNNVKDNVKHIFLNAIYRNFLNNVSIEHFGETLYLNDYYYFSRADFYQWLKNNTIISRQTIKLDINEYSKDILKFEELTAKYIENLKSLKSLSEIKFIKTKYHCDVEETLNSVGKCFYNSAVNVTKRNAAEVIINEENLPETFTSIKILKADIGKSLEIVYRMLYEIGAIKYTIATSLVRYDANPPQILQNHNSLILTIPFKLYIENIS